MNNIAMPRKKPKSPTLFTRNALMAAFDALFFSYQCPIRRYELMPTSSHPTYRRNRLFARTIISMEKEKNPR